MFFLLFYLYQWRIWDQILSGHPGWSLKFIILRPWDKITDPRAFGKKWYCLNAYWGTLRLKLDKYTFSLLFGSQWFWTINCQAVPLLGCQLPTLDTNYRSRVSFKFFTVYICVSVTCCLVSCYFRVIFFLIHDCLHRFSVVYKII